MKKITVLLVITASLLCTACNDNLVSNDNFVLSLSENSANISHKENTDSRNNSLVDNIVQVDWENNKVYKWKDYFEAGEYPPQNSEDFEIKMQLKDFPDTIFIWRAFCIYSSVNGEECTLVTGMPVMNAFFTDLNFDGFPELCTTVFMGSGIIDEHIIVYDYYNKKRYTLEDRMKFDYYLYLENNELYVRKLPYLSDENSKADIGKLVLENDKLVMENSQNL